MDAGSNGNQFFFGEFELDTERRALLLHGEEVRLQPKEYLTLSLLVQQAGKAVSRESLLDQVWPGTAVGDTSLARCVSALRKRLGADSIQAVPKFGYRFTPDVLTSSEKASAPRQTTPASAPAFAAVTAVAGVPPPARNPRWLWMAAAGTGAALLLAVVHASTSVSLLGWTRGATWTDEQTGLTWQREDNGVHHPRGQADVTLNDAKAYCANLRLVGRQDWRVPTIEELQTLYDPAESSAGVWGSYRPVYWHVKGGVALSGGETASDLTWTTEQTPAGEEQSYDFSFGRRNFDPVDFKAGHRVLCVRNGR